ncbi:MAG: C40 family peptidase, partial [Candidatus Sericytochromatia bacterium]|nr:C40 family peptidase [Candidatus Tanganyikabacteria bacterium]
GGAAPGGPAPAGPAGPAVQLSNASTNLLDLLKQAGIPAELLALLLELLQNGQLDEAQFQDLAKKFLKGEAQVQDLQAMAEQAKQNPPKAPPVRDGAAPGAPAGGVNAPDIAGNGNGAAAAKEALTYQGTPYLFGGNGRNGIDCSGLVQQVFKKQGINLPRTAAEQAKAGQEVPRDQLQAGDLVYFKNTYKPGVSHIGIYLGDGKFVHAPKTGDVVKVSNLDDAYYQKHWGGARRVT